MMTNHYYCDYCDRSFKDTLDTRRKHLQGLQHVKNKADYYSFYKDPETILKEESKKIPCKRFISRRDCAFKNSCKFSHYTPSMIRELQQIVTWKMQQKTNTLSTHVWPTAEEAQKFSENMEFQNPAKVICPMWTRPIQLQEFPDLPPSLWPITSKSITNSNFEKWG